MARTSAVVLLGVWILGFLGGTFGDGVGHDHIHNAQIPLAALVAKPPLLEIQPLLVSGPSKNRVDLVFFSDGYILEEKAKFLQDALRLAEDVSGNQTFNTVKPLMNFWAAFTASEESGVGTGGKPKKTPYGLYRDGTELRAVYYAYPETADAACTSMGEQCDFPILLGNDPLYGGLGGRFTVITSSILNGPQILRHELGHSIIPVGEEYDGGFAYFGVNAYHNTGEPVPWAHWMTENKGSAFENSVTNSSPSSPRVERSVMPIQIYPWTLLNTSSPYTSTFVSSGTFPRYIVRFSLSGLPEKSDLQVALDGKDLGWEPKMGLGVDRWHYDIKLGQGWGDGHKMIDEESKGLTGGEHELSFVLLNKDREGEAQLCSAEIIEFGSEDEFVSSPGYYGIFPTYSDTNGTSYRPTNEDCLMRIVTTPNFCSVCLEGLWHALLSRVKLIDDLVVSTLEESEGANNTTAIEVKLIPFAQFRLDQGNPSFSHLSEVDFAQLRALAESESYTITWSRNGVVLPEFQNQTNIEVFNSAVYAVDVRFHTSEVKLDKEEHLRDQRRVVV
ncbi:IgA peptidase M64-domain-containing protein [Lentinula aciculospora]|uniref:IgA peptidase M64-domain-containing protein n=1 Tax=Lentinula aciculospora TaxID=153920 RepID=A0A9W9DSP6_9AGAR|nr:IgA peptidase M64-domain-containing protein [Lentinula aciculospora]